MTTIGCVVCFGLLMVPIIVAQRGGPNNRNWRFCYICSGQYPDRECELYPKYVSKGPGQINCSRPYCTAHVRYTPRKYLLTIQQDGTLSTSKPLTPKDYEVDSIARECEDYHRGNKCEMDGNDPMGITCYITCETDLCNNSTRKPVWSDFEGVLGSSKENTYLKKESHNQFREREQEDKNPTRQRRPDDEPYPFYNPSFESNDIGFAPRDISESDFQGPRSFQGQEGRDQAGVVGNGIMENFRPMEGEFDGPFEYGYESEIRNMDGNGMLPMPSDSNAAGVGTSSSAEGRGKDRSTTSDGAVRGDGGGKKEDTGRKRNGVKKRGKKGKSSSNSVSTINQQNASPGNTHGDAWLTCLVGCTFLGSLQLQRHF